GFSVIGIGRQTGAIGGASRYCRQHVVREADEGALVAQIMALATGYRASYLLATSESDLLLINRHREELERCLKVLTPTTEALAKVLDKNICQAVAEQAGIQVPRTVRVASLEEAKAVAPTLSYPAVLKWADPLAMAAKLNTVGLTAKKFEYARTPQ